MMDFLVTYYPGNWKHSAEQKTCLNGKRHLLILTFGWLDVVGLPKQ